MPAKGHLATLSVKKYGYRRDLRTRGRYLLFKDIQRNVSPLALIESDENPHYPEAVRRFFPYARYQTFLSQRGSVTGQGELKKGFHDPLFSINHTFAMLRANINRLFRRTWCTTKKPQRLAAHLELYTYYHNEVLLKTKAN